MTLSSGRKNSGSRGGLINVTTQRPRPHASPGEDLFRTSCLFRLYCYPGTLEDVDILPITLYVNCFFCCGTTSTPAAEASNPVCESIGADGEMNGGVSQRGTPACRSPTHPALSPTLRHLSHRARATPAFNILVQEFSRW